MDAFYLFLGVYLVFGLGFSTAQHIFYSSPRDPWLERLEAFVAMVVLWPIPVIVEFTDRVLDNRTDTDAR